jgi:hypothetical protein
MKGHFHPHDKVPVDVCRAALSTCIGPSGQLAIAVAISNDYALV